MGVLARAMPSIMLVGCTGIAPCCRLSLLIVLPELFVELSLMTALPRKLYLSVEQRRALQLLADIPFGVTHAAMFVNGFASQSAADLQSQSARLRLRASRIKITEASRRALQGY
jgi:hypothetical protein